MPDDLFTASTLSTAFSFDPYRQQADPVQAARLKAYCRIFVDGKEVTNALNPHLLSVRIVDRGLSIADIELDDRDGKLPIPPYGASVYIELGWDNEAAIRVFDGWIEDIECGFDRQQGGRRMWVHAAAINWALKHKQPGISSLGEGAPPGQEQGTQVPFMQMASQVAGSVGASVSIHPALANLTRDFWDQSNESALHYFKRMSNEFGGVFRVSGNNYQLTKPGENVDASMATSVNAVFGHNLIGYRVHPYFARTVWGGAKQEWYSSILGKWLGFATQAGYSDPWALASAIFQLPQPAPNSQNAGQQNNGNNQGQYLGNGRVVINGEPSAQFNTFVQMVGCRPGVDGQYLIDQAEHVYSRQGYITWLEVEPWPEENIIST